MSIIAQYVSDRLNDGTYTLTLSEAKTRKLWQEVDAAQAELAALRARVAAAEGLATALESCVNELEIWHELDPARRLVSITRVKRAGCIRNGLAELAAWRTAQGPAPEKP